MLTEGIGGPAPGGRAMAPLRTWPGHAMEQSRWWQCRYAGTASSLPRGTGWGFCFVLAFQSSELFLREPICLSANIGLPFSFPLDTCTVPAVGAKSVAGPVPWFPPDPVTVSPCMVLPGGKVSLGGRGWGLAGTWGTGDALGGWRCQVVLHHALPLLIMGKFEQNLEEPSCRGSSLSGFLTTRDHVSCSCIEHVFLRWVCANHLAPSSGSILLQKDSWAPALNCGCIIYNVLVPRAKFRLMLYEIGALVNSSTKTCDYIPSVSVAPKTLLCKETVSVKIWVFTQKLKLVDWVGFKSNH